MQYLVCGVAGRTPTRLWVALQLRVAHIRQGVRSLQAPAPVMDPLALPVTPPPPPCVGCVLLSTPCQCMRVWWMLCVNTVGLSLGTCWGDICVLLQL